MVQLRPTMTTCTPALDASNPKSSQSKLEAAWIGTTRVVTSIAGRRRSTHCIPSDKSSHHRLRCRGPPRRERRARKEEPVSARLAFSAGSPVRMVMRMKVFLRPRRRFQHSTVTVTVTAAVTTRHDVERCNDGVWDMVRSGTSTAWHGTRTRTRAYTRSCTRRALAWSGRLTPFGSTQRSQS
jgi:hypothetical protein